jgi:hypothetical protein
MTDRMGGVLTIRFEPRKFTQPRAVMSEVEVGCRPRPARVLPFRFRNTKSDVIRVKVRHRLISACIFEQWQTHGPTASHSRKAI